MQYKLLQTNIHEAIEKTCEVEINLGFANSY